MTVHVLARDAIRAMRDHPASSLGDYHAIYLQRGGTDDDVVLTGTATELAELVGAVLAVAADALEVAAGIAVADAVEVAERFVLPRRSVAVTDQGAP